MKNQYKSAYAKKRAAAKRKAAGRKAKKPVRARRVRKAATKRRGVAVPTRIKHEPGVLSTSAWLSSSRPSKSLSLMERVGTRNIYTSNGSGQITNSSGYWGISNIKHLEKHDFQAILQEIPYEAQASGGGINSAPRRFVLESYLSDLAFSNFSTATVELELYDVVCRKDLPLLNDFTIGGLGTYNVGAYPADYIVQGLAAAQGTLTPALQSAMLIGSSPFDSPWFNEYFKVVKRTIVQLSAGAGHRHQVSLKPNRLLKEEALTYTATGDDAAGGMVCDAGFQCFTLVMLRPYPAMDSTTGHVGLVSTPKTSVGYTQQVRIAYTRIANTSAKLTYNTAIPQFPSTDVMVQVNATSGLTGPVQSLL